jgi:hypothetical protein
VVIKLTGSRDRDFAAANAVANLPAVPKDYVWHHVADFNPATGESTMQLVTKSAHNASKPHMGSVAQFEKHFGVEYDTGAASAIAEEKGWWKRKRKKKECG